MPLSRGWSLSTESEGLRRSGWLAPSVLPRGVTELLLSVRDSWLNWLQVSFTDWFEPIGKTLLDAAGDIGPFQLAILLTVVSLVLILFWRENYGLPEAITKPQGKNSKDSSSSSMLGGMVSTLSGSVKLIREDPLILYLGLSQAFFEGAVYTFGK